MNKPIKLETSVTKENLFNELQEKYPNGMKVFCDWIDEYKKVVRWNNLFNGGVPCTIHGYDGDLTESPKFHDLPHTIQLGIWIAFTEWYYDVSHSVVDLKTSISNVITLIDAEIEIKGMK